MNNTIRFCSRISLRGAFTTFAYSIAGLLVPTAYAGAQPTHSSGAVASCEAFCNPMILPSLEECLMEGDSMTKAECLEVCASENLASAYPCVLEAGDCCEALEDCLDAVPEDDEPDDDAPDEGGPDDDGPDDGEPDFGTTVSARQEVSNGRLTMAIEFMDQLALESGSQAWSQRTMAPYTAAAAKWLEALTGVDGLERHTIVMQVTVGPLRDGNGVAGPDEEISVGRFSIPTLGKLMVGNHTYVDGFDQTEFNANILHEMGHIIGIGSFTTPFVTDGLTGPEFRAPTTNGVDQYNRIYGTAVNFVPISDDRGHLHDYVQQEDRARTLPDGRPLPPLTQEFMANGAVFGAVTLGVLDDIGYTINYDAAEPYTPSTPSDGREDETETSGVDPNPRCSRAGASRSCSETCSDSLDNDDSNPNNSCVEPESLLCQRLRQMHRQGPTKSRLNKQRVPRDRGRRFVSSNLALQAVLLALGCGSDPEVEENDEQAPSASRGQPVADLRTMEEELAHVKGIAQKVVMNEQGYWEATFAHGIVMIYVPAGEFVMGNDELNETVTEIPSAPAHSVKLTHYWIAKTPVTRGQFRAFVADTGHQTSVELAGAEGCYVYNFEERGFVPTAGFSWRNAFEHVSAKHPSVVITDDHPVNCVSWSDADAFAKWFAQETGLAFRLPTEAQWEFGARGTDGRQYPWGTQDPDGTRANYADDAFNEVFPMTEQSQVHHGVNDGYPATSPVGSFPAGVSPVGALDMAGNVTEWVFDYMAPYAASAATNPLGPERGDSRAMKAGFWAGSAGRFGQSEDEIRFGHNIRADARQGDDPESADDHLGFRLAIGYVVR